MTPRPPESGWSESVAPKIHYHRSGVIGVNATGRGERYAVSGTPLGETTAHAQWFIYMARGLSQWATDAQRRWDLVLQPDGALYSVAVAGYCGPLDGLHEPYRSSPDNIVASNIENGSPRAAVLVKHPEASYYMWFEVRPNEQFTGTDGPAVLIHAFTPQTPEARTLPVATVAAGGVV